MSTGAVESKDIFAMSDEDFLNMGVPPQVAAAPESGAGEAGAVEAAPAMAPIVEDEPLVEGETPPVIEGEEDETPPAETPTEINPLEQPDDQLTPPAKPVAQPVAQAAPAAEAPAQAPPAGSSEAAPAAQAGESTPPNYEDLYKKLMAPLKANGKSIELRSPEELIQLAQMGANYTRKLQELAPHRKVLAMLENNGLLDEGQLSFLIDLSKKNPEAIKKLVKDAGLDPLEIDTSVEPAYREGNHRVSDEEVAFRSTLDELRSNPAGQETLQDINARWDQASKDALWGEPQLMTVIHAQRENGIYGRIVEEMDRMSTLGQLPPNTSFLQRYKIVGDHLQTQGRFADLVPAAEPRPTPAPVTSVQLQPAVVATRVAAPKPAVKDNDKASAAATTRSASRKPAETFVNPLSLSDDEFMKQFQNRL